MRGLIRSRPALGAAAVLTALVGLVPLAGCQEGGEQPQPEVREATLVLDFLPNAVHAGIYRAIAAGYYEEEGLDLKVITPTSTSDTIRLIAAGKADFGLADGIDLATQVSRGRAARGVMAILRRPAGGLITTRQAGPASPAGLAGETVGLTGAPSDRAVFETIVESAGGDPSLSSTVVIGFNGVQALRSGRITAFTGYIPEDATALRARGTPTRAFAFDRWGGPAYPGLVAFSSPERIRREPELVGGFVRATTRGYRDALEDPGRAIADLAGQVEGVEVEFARQAFAAYVPLIGKPLEVGRISAEAVRQLSRFLVENGLVEQPVRPGRFATGKFTESY